MCKAAFCLEFADKKGMSFCIRRTTMEETDEKTVNLLLALSFLATILVPLTGIMVHKMASAVFLLLCVVHMVIYRKKCGPKKWGLLLMVIFTFLSGLFGMVYEQIPAILLLHKLLSMACIVCLAIHLFVFQRGLWGRRKTV